MRIHACVGARGKAMTLVRSPGKIPHECGLLRSFACVEAIGQTVARESAIPAGNDVPNGTNTGESWDYSTAHLC